MATRPTSSASPPTTRTTCGPPEPCGTGWSSIDRPTCPGATPRSIPTRAIPSSTSWWRQLHAYGPDTARAPPRRRARLLAARVAGQPRAHAVAVPGRPRRAPRRPRRAGRSHLARGVSVSGRRGNVLDDRAMRFSFPEQVTDGFADRGDMVVFAPVDGVVVRSSIDHLDRDDGVVDLVWNEKCPGDRLATRRWWCATTGWPRSRSPMR